MAWTVKIGQGSGIRTQDRVTDIIIKEEWSHVSFSVTVQNPTSSERSQAKGRIDDAIIQIERGSETLITGFIEDVENGSDYTRYIGRSFLTMLGYSTNSTTDSSGNTNAEYSNATGASIASDLIERFCYYVDGDISTIRDPELTYSDIDFIETFGGDVKLHGRKVYDILRDMCNMYAKDMWADATWNNDVSWEASKSYNVSDFVSPTTPNDYAYECTTAGTSGSSEPTWGTTVGGTTNDGTVVWTCRNLEVTNKNIHIGVKSRGSSGSPYKTLYGGQHLKNIPVVKYRTQGDMVNCLRVIGKGTGKDRVSVWCQDDDSVAAYGYIEGSPFISNMIADEDTAKAVGDAIIADKKDPVEQLHVDLIYYINDLKYGDWVRIVDSYSNIDTTKRIKSITRAFNSRIGDSMKIEVGSMFNNYELIIADLTKKDVDNELEMTKLDGALVLTANDPPSDFVRCSGGDYYDSTGTIQTAGKGVCAFWSTTAYRLGGSNPDDDAYKKALVMIKDSDQTIWYRVGTQRSSKTDAQNDSISCDDGYMPLGEVILKGKGGGEVEDVYSKDPDPGDSIDSSYSYIYRDARPIVGSSSAGYGGDVHNPLTEDLSADSLYSITHLISLDGTYNSTTGYDELYIRNQAGDFNIAKFISWVSGETTSGNLDMLNNRIINIPDGDDTNHPANLGQLGFGEPNGWESGDILYGSDSNHLARLPKSTDGKVLTLVSGLPAWADAAEGVTNHSELNELDFASCGHYGTLAQLNALISDATLIDTDDSRLSDARTPKEHGNEAHNPDFLATDGTNGMNGNLVFGGSGYDIEGVKVLEGPVNVDFEIRGSNNGGSSMITFADWSHTNESLSISHLITLQADDIWGIRCHNSDDATVMYIGIGEYAFYAAAAASMNGNDLFDLGVMKAKTTDGIQLKASSDALALTVGSSGYSFIANADANMNGKNIKDTYEIHMHNTGTWDYLNIYDSSREKHPMQIMSSSTQSYVYLIDAELGMNGNQIFGVSEIKGHNFDDLKFWDYNTGEKKLSDLAQDTYWESAGGNAIRPKGSYNTITSPDSSDMYITSASSQDIYITPADGQVVYIG